jgi:hypothetical protein
MPEFQGGSTTTAREPPLKITGYSSVSADMTPAIRTQPPIEAGSDAITRYQLKTLQEKDSKQAVARANHSDLWEGVFHRRANIIRDIKLLQKDIDRLFESEARDRVLKTVGQQLREKYAAERTKSLGNVNLNERISVETLFLFKESEPTKKGGYISNIKDSI